MAAFVDEAMKEYGGKEWQYDMQTAPCHTIKHTTDIEAPLTVADLLRCCRPPAGVKSTNLLLDVHLSIADCGTPENIASAVQNQRVDELPAALQFAEPLPEQTKLGCIVAADGHGRLDVIKIIFILPSIVKGLGLSGRRSSPCSIECQDIMCSGPKCAGK